MSSRAVVEARCVRRSVSREVGVVVVESVAEDEVVVDAALSVVGDGILVVDTGCRCTAGILYAVAVLLLSCCSSDEVATR